MNNKRIIKELGNSTLNYSLINIIKPESCSFCRGFIGLPFPMGGHRWLINYYYPVIIYCSLTGR